MDQHHVLHGVPLVGWSLIRQTAAGEIDNLRRRSFAAGQQTAPVAATAPPGAGRAGVLGQAAHDERREQQQARLDRGQVVDRDGDGALAPALAVEGGQLAVALGQRVPLAPAARGAEGVLAIAPAHRAAAAQAAAGLELADHDAGLVGGLPRCDARSRSRPAPTGDRRPRRSPSARRTHRGAGCRYRPARRACGRRLVRVSFEIGHGDIVRAHAMSRRARVDAPAAAKARP